MINKRWEIQFSLLTYIWLLVLLLLVVQITWFVSQRISALNNHSTHSDYIEFVLGLWMASDSFNDALYLSDIDKIRNTSDYILTSVEKQFPNFAICLNMDIKLSGQKDTIETFSSCGQDSTAVKLLTKTTANITNEGSKQIFIDGVNYGRVSWQSVGTDNQDIKDYTFGGLVIVELFIFVVISYFLNQRNYIARSDNPESVTTDSLQMERQDTLVVDSLNTVIESLKRRLANIDEILKHNRHFNPYKSGELLFVSIKKGNSSTRSVRMVFKNESVIINRVSLMQVAESFWPDLLQKANRTSLINFEAIRNHAHNHQLTQEDKKTLMLNVTVKHKSEELNEQLPIRLPGTISDLLERQDQAVDQGKVAL